MAEFTYYYGVMGSGKSAKILELFEEYEKQNKKVLLLKPDIDIRDKNIIRSRNGKEENCITFSKRQNLIILYENLGAYIIIVDEANFCTPKQVEELYEISKQITVLCFGVMINYVGKILGKYKTNFLDCWKKDY